MRNMKSLFPRRIPSSNLQSHLPGIVLFSMLAFALTLLVSNAVAAQTFRGTILGTVMDPNGAVVPDATVTGKNVGTGIERSTVTDTFGNYSLSELQTGTYEVRIEKTGFQSTTVKGVIVEVSAEKRVDVTLPVAGYQQIVVITPSTPH